jgi:hypothetical protein
MTCHSTLNPISFVFEAYDGVGRFRTLERVFVDGVQLGTAPVDSEVSMFLDGKSQTVSNPVHLSSILSESPTAHQCFSRNWFRFAYARSEEDADSCTLTRIYDQVSHTEGSMIGVIRATVLDSSFRIKKVGPKQ